MKIELKNIKTSELASEETTFFRADIWIDGKKRGYAENDGRGGCTYYNSLSKDDRPFIEWVENFCKTLPPTVYTKEKDGFDGVFEMNLENYIDNLVEKHLKEKDHKKLLKKMEKGLLISKNPKVSYSMVTWKNTTIEGMLKNTVMKNSLKNTIEKYRNEGYTIMNTNLPQDVLGDRPQLTYEELAMYLNAD